MPIYSPTMLAKGLLCSKRIYAFNNEEELGDTPVNLDLKNPADLGTFKHLMMEFWLKEVNQKSLFPIKHKDMIVPRFDDFFSRSAGNKIKTKLSEKGVTIKDDFTAEYQKFIDTCKAEVVIIILARQHVLEEILIETLQPGEGAIMLSEEHMISVKGHIDCIFRCKETDYVVDWKSKIKENTDKYRIQLQSYLHIWRNKTQGDKDIKGLLISLTEYGTKSNGAPVPKYQQIEEFEQAEKESLISQIVDTTERPGPWCRYCSNNFAKEPCKRRSADLEIQKNTQLLEILTATLKYADVEIEISKFRRKNSKSQYFGYGKEYQITFIFPHSFREEYLLEHDSIRIQGDLKSKGGSRTFKVRKYVFL
jgi:hypothetical protein